MASSEDVADQILNTLSFPHTLDDESMNVSDFQGMGDTSFMDGEQLLETMNTQELLGGDTLPDTSMNVSDIQGMGDTSFMDGDQLLETMNTQELLGGYTLRNDESMNVSYFQGMGDTSFLDGEQLLETMNTQELLGGDTLHDKSMNVPNMQGMGDTSFLDGEQLLETMNTQELLAVHVNNDESMNVSDFQRMAEPHKTDVEQLINTINTNGLVEVGPNYDEALSNLNFEGQPSTSAQQELPPVQYGGGKNDYTIDLVRKKSLKRFGVTDVNFKLTFNRHMFTEQKTMKEVKDTLKNAFQDMIDHVKSDLHHGDIMRAAIHNDHLDLPVFVPLRPMEEMNANAMLDTLMKVLNSNEDVPFDSSCTVDVGAIKYPRGGHGFKFSSIERNVNLKKSIIKVCNDDNTCLVRAFLICYVHLSTVSDDEYEKTKREFPRKSVSELVLDRGRCPLWYCYDFNRDLRGYQTKMTKSVCAQLNLNTDRPLTYACIPKLENYFGVNIYVVSSKMGNAFSYVSNSQNEDRPKIFLYHEDQTDVGHFHAIVNITGFFSQSYFCKSCLKPYQNKDQHTCISHCQICMSDPCYQGVEVECPDCHRLCRSQECLKRHKIELGKKKSPCMMYYRCPTCDKTFQRSQLEDHQCGHYTCKSCNQYVPPEHLCYLRSKEKTGHAELYIFGDIEASQKDELVECKWGYRPQPIANCEECQDASCRVCTRCRHCKKSSCGKNKHTFCLGVTHSCCELCQDQSVTPHSICRQCGSRCPNCDKFDKKKQCYAKPPCEGTCGFRERTFKTLDSFGSFLFHDNHQGYTIFFHNLSYDGNFLLEYLLSQTIKPNFIIYRGSKIQMFTLAKPNIRVLDSFNFLPMALAKLPKAFQLQTQCKGIFPFGFISKNNEDYIGPYPPIEMYSPDTMSCDDRTKFIKWYEEKVRNGDTFNYGEEILKYCRDDVNILRQACLKFKRLLLEATGQDGGLAIHAFDSCTIASLCMDVFKRKFLTEEWKVRIWGKEEDEWVRAKQVNGNFFIEMNGTWVKKREILDRGIKIAEEVFCQISHRTHTAKRLPF